MTNLAARILWHDYHAMITDKLEKNENNIRF